VERSTDNRKVEGSTPFRPTSVLVLNWYSREKNSNTQEQRAKRGYLNLHSDPCNLFIFAVSQVTKEKNTHIDLRSTCTGDRPRWNFHHSAVSSEHLLPGNLSIGHDFLDQAVPQDP
jgi:hypothetical protein